VLLSRDVGWVERSELRYGHTPLLTTARCMAFELIVDRIHHQFGALQKWYK
jgi:hypothetical protein